MARRGYPPEFRRKVLDLLAAGRKVVHIARDLDLSDQTIYTWRRQDRIDRGVQPGLTTAEKTELGAANRKLAVGGRARGRQARLGTCWTGWCPQRPVRGHPRNGR
jgi:transposase-like protein